MGKTRKNWLHICNSLFTLIMAILGFSACENEELCEYGTPHATYKVKGKVVNSGEQHIADIQVIVKGMDGEEPEIFYQWDTLYTDSRGEFLFEKVDYPKKEFRIDYQDVKNQIYKTDSIDIEMPQPTGGKNWNRGTSEKDITIVLVEKSDEEDGE